MLLKNMGKRKIQGRESGKDRDKGNDRRIKSKKINFRIEKKE